ncbi:MAG TPA: hypothetical protein VJ881_03650 [Halanaerobiales bacterium]|nr:hypothetical protein [Halanaerobiales bacterium]
MILNTLVVFTSEIKIYINNKKFKWLNLILIILASFLVIFSLPYSEIIKTKNPLNGIIFTNFLIVIFSYYNLKSINGGIKIQNSMTGFEWKKNKGYSFWTIYSGIFLSRLLFNLIFLISTFPIAILVISLGGITFNVFFKFYIFLFLIAIIFSAIGILIRDLFPKMRGIITTYIYLLFLLLFVFTTFFEKFY